MLRLANPGHDQILEDEPQAAPSSGKEKKEPLREFWGVVYCALFESFFDRFIAYVGSVSTTIMVLVGVAHSAGMWTGSFCLFSAEHIHLWFYLTALYLLAPVGLVLLGRRTVRWARELATKAMKELGSFFAQLPQSASLPVPLVPSEEPSRR
ncbi:MAG: hypothetical protein PSV46_08405 [Reyranella sp.]|nr:hypothetical protein [Reyranella sp.]